jgi:predicted nuclease of predicted toxin-antitoxin system
MKLLLDQNLSYRLVKKLTPYFTVCTHVSDCGLVDAEDVAIWNYARVNDYTIVTFDADFFDMSVMNGHPPKIIWLRTGNTTSTGLLDLLISNQSAIAEFITNPDFAELSCLELA